MYTQCFEHNKNEILKIRTYITDIYLHVYIYYITVITYTSENDMEGYGTIIDKLRVNKAEGN